MKKTQRPKCLYFIPNMASLEEHAEEIAKLEASGYEVAQRNAQFVYAGEPVESFDHAAGALPPDYVAALREKQAAKFNGADPAKFDHDNDGKPGGSPKLSAEEKAAQREAQKAARRAAAEPAQANPAAQPREAASGQPSAAHNLVDGWGATPDAKPQPPGTAVEWKPNA